ncbi:hypothetical protein [Methanolobus halotolerans]|uniref:hypothetical protein n=1 Tax=Methanolobus halotolerans TaxID=2052935 RepID=UPI00107FCE2E|nr:hypothetical protein [Methanolobus halotolerans]
MSDTFIDYVNMRGSDSHTYRATILLTMHEIAAGIYALNIEYEFIISLSILLLILGAIKIMAVNYSPDDNDFILSTGSSK